jgi:CBS domain-containing protein
MAVVKDMLKQKGDQVWKVLPGSSIGEALAVMAEKNVGALVVEEAGQVIGIFSERDYARKALESAEFSLAAPVKEFMSAPVYFVTPEQTIEECMALMTEKRFRHLPVMDRESLVGLVSIGDVVKQTLSEMDVTIKDLEEYIWIHMI